MRSVTDRFGRTYWLRSRNICPDSSYRRIGIRTGDPLWLLFLYIQGKSRTMKTPLWTVCCLSAAAKKIRKTQALSLFPNDVGRFGSADQRVSGQLPGGKRGRQLRGAVRHPDFAGAVPEDRQAASQEDLRLHPRWTGRSSSSTPPPIPFRSSRGRYSSTIPR